MFVTSDRSRSFESAYCLSPFWWYTAGAFVTLKVGKPEAVAKQPE